MELKGSKKLMAKDEAEKGTEKLPGNQTPKKKYTYLSIGHGLDDLFIVFFNATLD